MAGKVPADHPPRGMRDLAARLRLPLGGHRRQDLLGFPAAAGVPVAMARQLRGAGFDEDAVRRREKADLIVSRLKSERYDSQKELTVKYERCKALSEACLRLTNQLVSQQSALSETRKREENLKRNLAIQMDLTSKLTASFKATEIMLKRELASQQSALAETRKREENLKRNLAIQKERLSTAEIKRLRQEQEVALVRRRQEFDTEMENKLASFEEEIDARKALLDQRETAINEQEDSVAQREQTLNLRLAELANKEEPLGKKSDELREEEKRLSSKREALHIELQKEKEEIRNMKLDLVREKSFFEETENCLKVGKKRLNNALSYGDSEILQPKQKQQKSTTETVIGGEIDSNCSRTRRKIFKDEHDAVRVGLCGKGLHNPQAGELASSVDVLLVNGKSVPEGDRHSKDNSVSAAEPDEDSDDEVEEEKTSTAKKIWRFLIT